MTQVEEINARELYLRPVTPQQLLARLPSDQLAVKVSKEDFEVKHCHPVCIGLLYQYHSMVLISPSDWCRAEERLVSWEIHSEASKWKVIYCVIVKSFLFCT